MKDICFLDFLVLWRWVGGTWVCPAVAARRWRIAMAQGGASLESLASKSPRRLRGVAASSDTRLRSQVTSHRLVLQTRLRGRHVVGEASPRRLTLVCGAR